MKRDIAYIVPCYNEAEKLNTSAYEKFLKNYQDVVLFLVNDGSTDRTADILKDFCNAHPEQTVFVNLEQNQGKAGAVREGMLASHTYNQFEKAGYVDADLAISFEEAYELSEQIKDKVEFCFGSRIVRVGAEVERKLFRHLVGRFIATLIANILKLKVYDTQCGVKMFKADLTRKIFAKPLISKWLFDVELFFRIYEVYGKEEAIKKMLEQPLKRCVNPGGSKVKLSYFFKLFGDLLKIRKTYRHTLK